MARGINQVPEAEVKSKRLNNFIYIFSLANSCRQAAPEQKGCSSEKKKDLFPVLLGAQSLQQSVVWGDGYTGEKWETEKYVEGREANAELKWRRKGSLIWTGCTTSGFYQLQMADWGSEID